MVALVIPRMRNVLLLALLGNLSVGCSKSAPAAASANTVRQSECEVPVTVDGGEPETIGPPMTALRQLRRMTLVTTNRFPTREKITALAALTDASAQDAFLKTELDRLMSDPMFYDTMVDFGHAWMNVPPVANIADVPEYGLPQQRAIVKCPDGTLHAGKWASPNGYNNNQPCNGLRHDGTPAVVKSLEPWWAEGTHIDVVGLEADERSELTTAGGAKVDCSVNTGAGFSHDGVDHCGCGPHLIYCMPGGSLQDYQAFLLGNPQSHRRLAWDEPARLFAHLVWHDRPLVDLIAGDYSVGPVNVQSTYVRYGGKLGDHSVEAADQWWRSSTWASAPHDPHHEATDPQAWSEFKIHQRNPFLLAERSYQFDPRTQPRGSIRGVPSAGVMTMPGLLAGTVRERVRGARMLEMFACETFVPPPPTAHFSPYINDPAGGGPCVTCHSRIDPASIHFKRFMRSGAGFQMLGVGNAHEAAKWNSGQYPYNGDPWDRMARLWAVGTRMTPVSKPQADADPEALFIDFLPPDQTLYGATSDGTVGPLGFAKLLISSGSFDRCVVRKLHQRFVGRDVDPTAEAGYLEKLVTEFTANDRKARPFVQYLTKTPAFRSGL